MSGPSPCCAVGIPAFARSHVGDNHIETLVVVAAQYMRVAHAAGRTDFRRLNHGQIVVQSLEVESVVTDGIAYLLLVHAVAVEVGEEIAVELVGVSSGSLAGTATQHERYCGEG